MHVKVIIYTYKDLNTKIASGVSYKSYKYGRVIQVFRGYKRTGGFNNCDRILNHAQYKHGS